LADELQKEFSIETSLIPGELHSFDVIVNGVFVFSKSEEQRFPKPEEIIKKIKELLQEESLASASTN
jgi:selT/selW/selH-like putative selenoprotein